MVAQISPTNIKAAFALELAEADTLTDDMIDGVVAAELTAQANVLNFIDTYIERDDNGDLSVYRPLFDDARFIARANAGDAEAIRIYQAGKRLQEGRQELIERERAELDALFSE